MFCFDKFGEPITIGDYVVYYINELKITAEVIDCFEEENLITVDAGLITNTIFAESCYKI